MSEMMHSEADLLPLSYEDTHITRPQSFFCLNARPFVVSPSIRCRRMRSKEQASLGILWDCLQLLSWVFLGWKTLGLTFVCKWWSMVHLLHSADFIFELPSVSGPQLGGLEQGDYRKGACIPPRKGIDSSLGSQGLSVKPPDPFTYSACSSVVIALVVLLHIGKILQTCWRKQDILGPILGLCPETQGEEPINVIWKIPEVYTCTSGNHHHLAIPVGSY